MRRVMVAILAGLLAGGTATVIVRSAGGSPGPETIGRVLSSPPARRGPVLPTTAPGPVRARRTHARSTGPLVLAGCPPPTRPPGPPGPPPWHPSVLVPNSALPAVTAPHPWRTNIGAITGKGMWVWEFDRTEGGNAQAIVTNAVQAGLRQLWVRVGSSKDGFYGAGELGALLAPAHAAGLSVIGWGFPYLYDPVGDARWTAQALNWRGPRGERLDGFSADIEKSTEGVALSKRRVGVYLAAVRKVAGDRLVVATVYRPTDENWDTGAYPYRTMARYVDAFAPMVYWGCDDPRTTALQAVPRLATLRPVHLIGQAYNMAAEGGRTAPPSPREITLFLDVGREHGAVGASFWDWQEITTREWNAMATFDWPDPSARPAPVAEP